MGNLSSLLCIDNPNDQENYYTSDKFRKRINDTLELLNDTEYNIGKYFLKQCILPLDFQYSWEDLNLVTPLYTIPIKYNDILQNILIHNKGDNELSLSLESSLSPFDDNQTNIINNWVIQPHSLQVIKPFEIGYLSIVSLYKSILCIRFSHIKDIDVKLEYGMASHKIRQILGQSQNIGICNNGNLFIQKDGIIKLIPK